MKKTNSILMLTAVFVVIFAAACSAPAAPATQVAAPVVEQPAVQQPAAPADTQAAPVVENTVSAAPAAPVVPDTIASETYCVKKIPYQNILLSPETTFEAQDPSGELKCSDSGTDVDGKNVITCTGKQLTTYELKLSNSADGSEASSAIIKVNIGACPSH